MSDFLRIGQYQLSNLIATRAKFLYLDLRAPETRASEALGHILFTDSRAVSSQDVLKLVRELEIPKDGPIVLICENGAKSVAAAELLAQNSFINVFVVEGGTEALAFD